MGDGDKGYPFRVRRWDVVGTTWLARSELREFCVRHVNADATRLQRGDLFACDASGLRGRFVGVTPMGVFWGAFPGQDYEAMCARFDARWGHA